MKKLSKKDLISIEGGITCANAEIMLAGLYQNNYAQYQSLVALSNSGIRFQCTNNSGASVYFSVG